MTARFLSDGPPLLSVEKLAAALGCSTWAVRRLLPRLGFVRVGGLVRIPRENVDRYLQSRYVPPQESASPRRRSAAPGQLADLVDAAEARVRRRGR